MMATITDSPGERGPRAWRVREEQRARLRRYFLSRLGSTREADECVRETVCRLSVFKEDGLRENGAARMLARLMRTAALLCAERLGERQ